MKLADLLKPIPNKRKTDKEKEEENEEEIEKIAK